MNNKFQSFNSGRAVFFLLVFICCIVAAAVLKIAANVILPLVIAFLLALVMYPIIKWLDRHRIPRAISILLIIFIIIAGLYILGMVLFYSGSNILSIYPNYESRFTEIYVSIGGFFDLPYDESLTVWENIWGILGIRNWVRNFAFSFSSIFLDFLMNAVLMVLFLVFILMEASIFKKKIETAFGNRISKIDKMSNDLINQITRYLTTKFFLSLATGIVVAVGLGLIGVEFAILWGIIQFILNFIPNLGSIAAGVGATLFALLQFWPSPLPIILTGAVMLGSNMVIGNFLDTKITGDNVGLSALVVLISLGIWGFIWGFAGMILAVPMTVIIRIVCENIPILEPVSILLGSKKTVRTYRLFKPKLPKEQANGFYAENPVSEENPQQEKTEN